jgi:predicted nucleotidyltransferase
MKGPPHLDGGHLPSGGAGLRFPTPLHEQAAEAAYDFFRPQAAVDTVLVVNSIARGQGVPESDLDMAVLVHPGALEEEVARLEAAWRHELDANQALLRFQQSGKLAHVHLDLVRGQYVPDVWDDGGGPDGFELGIGNQLAYGAPLQEAGPYYRRLQEEWLPYYDPGLRRQRLEMARAACAYDLEHVPFFVRRELYFQAFDRLYKAFQEFLQALFIACRVYPLAYNKWIRLQVEEWLGLPELYRALPPLISVKNIESSELVEKARDQERLLQEWVVE